MLHKNEVEFRLKNLMQIDKIKVFEPLKQDLSNLNLVLKNTFKIYVVEIGETNYMCLQPSIDNCDFRTIKKRFNLYQELVDNNCFLLFDEYIGRYKKQLLKLRIPFVMGEENMFLPFLGLLLTKEKEKSKDIITFSPIAQQIVLSAIYFNWYEKSSIYIEEYLKVSRMSVTRAFNEIASTQLATLSKKNRTLNLVFNNHGYTLFENSFSYFASPIYKTFYIENNMISKLQDIKISGLNALSHYGEINPETYNIYAISKVDYNNQKNNNIFRNLSQNNLDIISDATNVIQILKYIIQDKLFDKTIDPISAYLSLSNEDQHDVRIESDFRESLKQIINKTKLKE